MPDYRWDAFISHASSDNAFARPLAEELKCLLDVWFDEHVLTIGDRLLARIDEGLRDSRFGIVVLSEDFFARQWPQRELDGMSTLERDGVKSILPVWHNVTYDYIRSRSPLLAGRLAVSSERGLHHVVVEIIRSILASSFLPLKIREHLAELGWACYAMMQRPQEPLPLNLRTIVLKNPILQLMFSDGELELLENDSGLVDIISSRIIEWTAERGYATFMIGGLGPALLEHHANPEYQVFLLDFFYKAHGRSLGASEQERIWSVGKSRDTHAVRLLTQELAVAGRVTVQ